MFIGSISALGAFRVGSNPAIQTRAVYRSVRYTKNLGVALRVDYKVSAHILENGVIGNTRGFESLILSSNLSSPANNMVT